MILIFIIIYLIVVFHTVFTSKSNPIQGKSKQCRSDRTGKRKPLLILPMLGNVSCLLIYLLNVYFQVIFYLLNTNINISSKLHIVATNLLPNHYNHDDDFEFQAVATSY